MILLLLIVSALFFPLTIASTACTVPENCTASKPVNSMYVNCVNNLCVCDGRDNCFTFNDNPTYPNQTCTVNTVCFRYTGLGNCESTARNWLTALLLHLFLGGFGVGEFSIGQNGFGAGQLVLFLSLLILPFIIACTGCCIAPAAGCMKDSPFAGCLCISIAVTLFVVTIILIIGAILGSTAWWIADVALFAQNLRPDLNGCALAGFPG